MLAPSVLSFLVLSTLGTVRAAPMEEGGTEILPDSEFTTSSSPRPLEWELEYAPGKVGKFWGTMKEVHDQALEMNPNFIEDMGVDPTIFVHSDDDDDFDAELEKRAISNVSPLQKRDKNICGERRKREKDRGAIFIEVNKIIADLRKMPGRPSLPAKSGNEDNCGKIACRRFSLIEWCNDNDFPVKLGKFDDIANAAFLIKTECKLDYMKGNDAAIGGKRVHDDKITVKVSRNKSGKC